MNSDLTYSPPFSNMGTLSFLPDWFSNQSLKDFEEAKNFRLVFQEVNPAIPGKLIYESQCIFGLTHGHMREGPATSLWINSRGAEVLS